MSREKIVRAIDEIENIKANLSFIFFADKAITAYLIIFIRSNTHYFKHYCYFYAIK